jgi:plasmid maintenance system killer protein
MPHKSKAQDRNLSLIQDVKFEKLLTEKKKITSITVNERYKIQVFSGDSDKAKRY